MKVVYSPHHRPHAEGHIFIDKPGACTIELTGAASMTQEELDGYGRLFAAALASPAPAPVNPAKYQAVTEAKEQARRETTLHRRVLGLAPARLSTEPAPAMQDPLTRRERAEMVWAILKSYMLDECSLDCAAVSPTDEKNLINEIYNSIPDYALSSPVAPAPPDLNDLADRFVSIIQDGMAQEAGSKSIASILINELLLLKIVAGPSVSSPDHPEPPDTEKDERINKVLAEQDERARFLLSPIKRDK